MPSFKFFLHDIYKCNDDDVVADVDDDDDNFLYLFLLIVKSNLKYFSGSGDQRIFHIKRS